jgi:hypothetical protein
MTKPHKIDFHQRVVPSPMERKGKPSPRRIMTTSVIALTQISASFRTAEVNVVPGMKNTTTSRMTSIPKSEMNSPTHVAHETLVDADG